MNARDRKGRAARLAKLLARKWRVSAKGNTFLDVPPRRLCVFAHPEGRWSYRVGPRFGLEVYDTPRAAQVAAIEDLERSTRRESRRIVRAVRDHVEAGAMAFHEANLETTGATKGPPVADVRLP
jgi:hypothetical protein